MEKDFFLAIEDLEREKGINSEVLLAALETALLAAYKKNSGNTAENVRIKLNPEKGIAKFYATKTIVDVVTNPDTEISLADAKEHKKSYKLAHWSLASEKNHYNKQYNHNRTKHNKQIFQFLRHFFFLSFA